MPPRSPERRLRDILEAVLRIRGYVEGLDFEAFRRDPRTVDAVLHNLAVIGEAAAKLPEELAAGQPPLPVAEMRGLRNVVVHEYFGVSLPILWETVERDLPALEERLRALLAPESR